MGHHGAGGESKCVPPGVQREFPELGKPWPKPTRVAVLALALGIHEEEGALLSVDLQDDPGGCRVAEHLKHLGGVPDGKLSEAVKGVEPVSEPVRIVPVNGHEG